MKIFVLLTLLFFEGALASVYQLADKPEVSEAPLVLSSDIPVKNLPSGELTLLNQLKLNTQSSEENQQHIWNRVIKCESCHAYNMYAGNGYLPILQGQNQEYLFSKLLMFKNNRRSYHPLGRYLESLSSRDLMDISVYYSGNLSDLKRTLVPIHFLNENKINKPEPVVSIKSCAECHGESGNGGQLIPAISGQNRHYLSYRIREIADNNSRVHFKSDAPVSCKIKQVNVRQSWKIANLLSVVVDKKLVKQGAQVYRSKCAECHENGQNSPNQGEITDWSTHLQQGTRILVNNTLVSNSHKLIRGHSLSFSRNEMTDAIHYMINQLQQSL